MSINWFPGHMAKALREMKSLLNQVDLVVEICDARVVRSSRNPELRQISRHKPVLTLLNKQDLADPRITRAWLNQLSRQGEHVLAFDSIKRTGSKEFHRQVRTLAAATLAQSKARGRRFRPVRLLIVGIPNTGKSTFINALSQRKATRTANIPGVTRQYSWVRHAELLEMLDSPGVMPTKIVSQTDQLHLAATGAIPNDLLPLQEVAQYLWRQLLESYPELIKERFLSGIANGEPDELFAAAALSRGCLMTGGVIDRERFARILIDEFRSGRIGRISLEEPHDD